MPSPACKRSIIYQENNTQKRSKMMQGIFPARNSLQFKYGFTTSALVCIAILVMTLVGTAREQEHFRHELEEQAKLLLTGLSLVSDDALYLLDVEHLSDLMSSIERSHFITGQIYDAEGRVIADTEAPANLVYEAQPDIFGMQLIHSQTPLFIWQHNYILAGQAVMAGNETIGAVSITLPTDMLHEQTSLATLQSFGVAFVIVYFTIIFSFATTRRITQPLQQLTKAAVQLATEGSTKQVVVEHASEELQQLAQVFNHMSSELSTTIDQLNDKASQLETANQQIEEALHFKSQILSNVSHDARTPLSVIMLRAEMMLKGMYGELCGEQRQGVETIYHNAKQLQFFVNNLLDGAQLDANKLELNNRQFAVPSWLDEVDRTLSTLAKKKRIAFKLESSSDIPTTIYGDLHRINQIVFNLVGNAIKFTDKGYVKLRVFCSGEHWNLEISDTGPGIPEDAMNRLFDAFYQVDGTSTRAKMQGVGLGLSIVKQLVDLMGGHIRVTSHVGEGSTFLVSLPYQVESVKQL